MLDADEAAGFDEAMRHDPELRRAYREIDRLAAAVAVVTTIPIAPAAGQLERLQLRLGLMPAKATNWLGISGWAAAAALTLVLLIDRSSSHGSVSAGNTRSHPIGAAPQESALTPPSPKPRAEEKQNVTRQIDSETDGTLALAGGDGKAVAKVEAKRLIQEIEVLRGQLENFQERDRQRFESVPGIAWPVVMRMVPPGASRGAHGGLALTKEDPSLTAMLGDALAAASTAAPAADPGLIRDGQLPAPTAEPSAIPIYDAARKSGTLVVTNLPLTTANEAYNLWVTTQEDEKPVYVGRVPNSNDQGTVPYDFSLGPKTTVPTGYMLTKDPLGEPTPPTASNTVLQGPN